MFSIVKENLLLTSELTPLELKGFIKVGSFFKGFVGDLDFVLISTFKSDSSPNIF